MPIIKKLFGYILGDLLPILLVVAAFYLLRFFYFDFVFLPEDQYGKGTSIFLPWFSNKTNILILLVLTLPLFMRKATWKAEDLKVFHLPLLLLILILAARYAFSPFNLFLGEEFLAERLVIILLALAAGLHPIFLPAFLVSVFLFVGQLQTGVPNPLGWENIYPLFVSLIALHAFLLVRAVCPPAKLAHLVLVLVTMQCAHYFHSGLEKLLLGPGVIDWVTNTRLDALFVSHYLGGWLPFRSEESVLLIASKLKEWNVELAVLVLVLELSTLVALFSKNFTWLLLYLLVGFHLAVFFTCGIFFWPWMVVNLILLMLISRADWHPEFNSFTFGRSCIAVLLVAFAAGHFTGLSYYHPVRLAWFDTPYEQIYRLTIVDENDETHEVPHFVMAPYHYQFIQNEFAYVNQAPQLAYHSGMVREETAGQSLALVQAISEANSLVEVRSLYPKYADARLDDQKKAKLTQFLTTYFDNVNRELSHENDEIALLRLGPIRWAFPELKAIKEVRLEYYDALYTTARIEKSEPQTLLVASMNKPNSVEPETNRDRHPLSVLASYFKK